MLDMMVNTYFSQGTVDGLNCINLLNVCSKFKFKGNDIFTHCVYKADIPYVSDADNNNPAEIL